MDPSPSALDPEGVLAVMVSEAPPLTQAQRSKIARVLKAGAR